MGLVYAGIDEAGYGPMLGPLTVAMAAFRLEAFDPEAPPPDLWQELGSVLGREPRDAPKRIPIADSKRLKLSNQLKRRHPLVHLERGVLAVLAASGHNPASDAELFDLLGADLETAPWFRGEPTPLPLANDQGSLRLDAAALRRAMDSASIGLISLRCRTLGAAGFNKSLRDSGSKAAVCAASVGSLIAEAARRWGGEGDDELRLAVDRQSGRADYSGLLANACPGATVALTDRTPHISRYDVNAGRRGFGVRFETEAEDHHLPVALASMTAKLVRELAMLRFNRYWSARVPELKPTAGYVTDARRWLADAGTAITAHERDALVRLA